MQQTFQAPEGQYLTQGAADTPASQRIIATEIVLGIHDTADRWRVITAEEADSIRAEQADALAAQEQQELQMSDKE